MGAMVAETDLIKLELALAMVSRVVLKDTIRITLLSPLPRLTGLIFQARQLDRVSSQVF